jgi:mycothiol synthase
MNKGFFSRLFRKPVDTVPQLEMMRHNLEDLPEIDIPHGYGLRTHRPGDEEAWCRIMEGNVGKDWTPAKCHEKLTGDPRFKPESLFFATFEEAPVASACAWTRLADENVIGEVHMVAALQNHRGKRLGHLVNTAVLHRLRELGFEKAHLLSDDWRIPAIKSYLTAGFQPLNTHESHPPRWEKLFDQLGLSNQ